MPDEERGEPSKEDGGSRFQPKNAVAPITMMVLFIIVTIAGALYLAPLLSSMGYSSAFGERAENPLWAFAFLGMMILVAVGILVLRKLLKRRKRNLKYLLAFAVFLATIGVLTPILDLMANGAPPEWEEYGYDLDQVISVYPLDPMNSDDDDLIVLTTTSFHHFRKGMYEYDDISSIEDLQDPFPLHYGSGVWVLGDRLNGSIHVWTIRNDGELSDLGIISHDRTGLTPIGINVAPVLDREESLLLTFWENETDWSVSTSSSKEPSRMREWNQELNSSRGPYIPARGWTTSHNFAADRFGIMGLTFTEAEGEISLDPIPYSKTSGVVWLKQMGDLTLYWSNRTDADGGLFRFSGDGDSENIHSGSRLYPSRVSVTSEGNNTEVLYVSGGYLHSVLNGESHRWDVAGIRSLYQSEPRGKIIIAGDQGISIGHLERGERNQYYLGLISFALSGALILALLKKPKWWLVDLGGLIMGAGVIAMMGISFPLLFTLLLLVLLAGYDAVAVYKTKHMISLADSVVEAKMPILLVFPMKWSYRYEDETNLMDPKRKRESLFMGLGDVIIPGLFIVSVTHFLSPVGGARLFGVIHPPLGVAIFALLGMLLGYAVLIRWVLKGKAHAGLPPLNGGSILGFLVGYLLLYGTVVFW
ncbi:MAG: presenilin family intramembrane aspartyl protease PSH [Thermoplasmatota archaeon]